VTLSINNHLFPLTQVELDSQPKSSTKPARIDSLDGIEMLDIAAGQNTTFFIARPPPTEKAKAEAKQLENVPAPVSAPAPPLAKDDTPADSHGASAFKPSIDLSGFGFAFGAPSPATDSKPASSGNATPINEEERKKNADGISRTQQGAWEELPRWPTLYDAQDECIICSRVENEEKGDSLECEKVSLRFVLIQIRRRADKWHRTVRGRLPSRMFDSSPHRDSRWRMVLPELRS